MRKTDVLLIIWTLLLLLMSPLAVSKHPILRWPVFDKDSTDVSEPQRERSRPPLLFASADDDVPVAMSDAVEGPKPITRVEPAYTEEARREKIGGTVLLRVVIARSGAVTKIAVVKPLGYGLDEEAMKALAQWKFQPARLKKTGEAVPVAAEVEINFNPVQ